MLKKIEKRILWKKSTVRVLAPTAMDEDDGIACLEKIPAFYHRQF